MWVTLTVYFSPLYVFGVTIFTASACYNGWKLTNAVGTITVTVVEREGDTFAEDADKVERENRIVKLTFNTVDAYTDFCLRHADTLQERVMI